MSLDKVGKRTRNTFERSPDEPPLPERPALFYQDGARLPVAARGEGIYIIDTEGRRYLDGCSGAVSTNLGHGHPRMIEAAKRQLGKIAFAYRTQFENEPANELADLLARLSPPELDRVFFVNSGSEAVESAIKLARQYWWSLGETGKTEIIARRPSYHGATLGALSATDYAPLNIPYRAMTQRFPKVSAPFCYHCPLGHEFPGCNIACAHELEERIRTVGAQNIAAFIMEPIGGASTGAAVPPDDYLPIVERICHEHRILLIIDDVMTGIGRTGTFFGYEHWDVTPDIVATSKGLSGGYAPIGAIIASEAVVGPVIASGGFMHGHTYAGNPLSCAIAREAVQVIIDDDLVENARVVGTLLHERLHELRPRFPIIGDVRGRGLLAAIELVQSRERRASFPPDWYVALELTRIARDHGLLVYPRRSRYGLSGDHVLVAPPLIIDAEGVDELIRRLEASLQQLTKALQDYLPQEAYVDDTVERYEQEEAVPAYALGQIDDVAPEPEANVLHQLAQDLPPEEER